MCFIIAGDTSSTMSYHDAEEQAVLGHDGQAGDAVVAAELVELLDRRVGADGDRVTPMARSLPA